MADVLTPDQRSFNMSRIRGKGNKSTEQRMVTLLKAHRITGWRRHYALPGKPDFVFRPQRVAIFVDGCFWHKCPRCFKAPSSNSDYWVPKIQGNVRRDRRVNRQLRQRGWRVMRVWEHSLRDPDRVAGRIARMLDGRPRAAGPAD